MIAFHDISKSFFGVPVLRGVSFAVPAGHTLGLVGENGAGKSTLMNILGGNHRPDAGRMTLAGEDYAPRRPADAARRGIGFIHQELNLFANLSVAENLFLNAFPLSGRFPCIDRTRLRRETVRLLGMVGLEVAPDLPVERLSAGERQLVEIAKALRLDARLIILDEPTSSLSSRERDKLFAVLAQLRQRGIAMIYISHALEEVLRLCDDVVVLRDGEVVESGVRADFTVDRMVSLMVGRSLKQLFPARCGTPSAEALLEARKLSQPGIVHGIDLTVHRSEVLGIFGLMGAGRSELARILFGLDPHSAGTIALAGVPLAAASPRQRIERGLAFLTESRREEGLCLDAAIADNLALVSLRNHARPPFGLVKAVTLREAIGAMRAAVHLTPSARDEQPVRTLSGGNQQKVVLAKWLLAKPRVLILDEPTRGIDVGAKSEIYQLISDLAAQGAGILFISSEIEELIGLCDRLLVMSRGEITDELARPEFDRDRILRAALHDPAPRHDRA